MPCGGEPGQRNCARKRMRADLFESGIWRHGEEVCAAGDGWRGVGDANAERRAEFAGADGAAGRKRDIDLHRSG